MTNEAQEHAVSVEHLSLELVVSLRHARELELVLANAQIASAPVEAGLDNAVSALAAERDGLREEIVTLQSR